MTRFTGDHGRLAWRSELFHSSLPGKYLNSLSIRNDLPPSAKDFDQPLPRSFVQVMTAADKSQRRKHPKTRTEPALRSTGQSGKMKKRQRLKEGKVEEEEDEKEDSAKLPKFKRRRGESTKEFLQRVDQETNERILAAHKKLKTTSERRKRLVTHTHEMLLMSKVIPDNVTRLTYRLVLLLLLLFTILKIEFHTRDRSP